MKIVSWNMNFWIKTANKSIETVEIWKKLVRFSLEEMDADFVLLQEINPFVLFDEKQDSNESYYGQYEFKHCNQTVLYHEYKSLDWGNAIIFNSEKWIKHINVIDMSDKKSYYGRQVLMSYTFETADNNKITIINFYKKREDGKYDYNDPGFFEDIETTFASVNNKNIIIFAGDFNASPTDDKTKYVFERLETIGFINLSQNIGSTMIDYEYQNDSILVNKPFSSMLENLIKFSQWNLSDHYGLKCKVHCK